MPGLRTGHFLKMDAASQMADDVLRKQIQNIVFNRLIQNPDSSPLLTQIELNTHRFLDQILPNLIQAKDRNLSTGESTQWEKFYTRHLCQIITAVDQLLSGIHQTSVKSVVAEYASQIENSGLYWNTMDCYYTGMNHLGSKDIFILKSPCNRFENLLQHYIFNEFFGDDPQNNSEIVHLLIRAARSIFCFFEYIENIRKCYLLRKRTIHTADYYISLNLIPREFLTDIVHHQDQRDEWCHLLNISHPDLEFSKLPKKSGAEKAIQETVPVNTALFTRQFKKRLISAIPDVFENPDGLFFFGDNFHALQLIQSHFSEKIQCIYIDPPFNTETNVFDYRDNYSTSTWLTFMDNRLELTRPLLAENGTLYVHIDCNQKERLRLALDRRFKYITEIIWRIGWISGFKSMANKFIRNHDTIYQYSKSGNPLFIKSYLPYPKNYKRRQGPASRSRGIPLEDTWNCSAADPLNSIQICSFSKEKVGREQLTQKNEKLLSRMIFSSSREGDWILDYFAGTGTTCAVAHKMKRKWIGIECGEHFHTYSLPRMQRVLMGDKFGISKQYPRQGGLFKVMALEPTDKDATAFSTIFSLPQGISSTLAEFNLDSSVNYQPITFKVDPLDIPRGEFGDNPWDALETFKLWTGFRLDRLFSEDGLEIWFGEIPDEGKGLVIWRSIEHWPLTMLLDHIDQLIELNSLKISFQLTNGLQKNPNLQETTDRGRLRRIEDVMSANMLKIKKPS